MAAADVPLQPGKTYSLFAETRRQIVIEHYVENMLCLLLVILLGVALWASHVHNDPFCSWAQTTASNVLSALFGIMVKQKTQPIP